MKLRFGPVFSAFIFLMLQVSIGQAPLGEWRHGTVIAWSRSQDQLIIVADSGIESTTLGKLPEKACKIASLSDGTLFFYTGNLAQLVDLRTNKEVFSQEAIAREAYGRLRAQPQSYKKLVDIATEFSVLVRTDMDKFLKTDRHSSERIGLAGFAGLDESNHPRLVLVKIPIIIPNNGAPAYTASPDIFEWPSGKLGTGLTEQNMGVLEFLDAKTERAKSAAAKFESSIPNLR